MNLEQIIIVAGITWLAVISPGADFAVVSRNSSVYGRAAGVASSVGIASGCWVHIGYAVFGIGLILHYVPNAFTIIQLCGAIYLVYVGISTFFSKSIKEQNSETSIRISNWKHFATGLLTNSLNPKTSIFIISMYTQVIGTQTSLIEQFLFGLFVCFSHLLWFVLIAIFMSTQKIRCWVMQYQKVFNGLIGGMLVALGIALFMTSNLQP